MVFVILISIVFIAELIIAFSIIINLVKLDKNINEAAVFIDDFNPRLKEVLELMSKISDQVAELVPIWVENLKKERDKIILNQTKSLISGILFWGINIKVINRLRKTKIIKALWKGLTLVQNVLY